MAVGVNSERGGL